MHRNNLAIERDCSWGVAEKDPHYVVTEEPAAESENIEILTA